MPFLNQAGVDWFLMNATPYLSALGTSRHVRLSLHTADVPSRLNELTALSAPGYERVTIRFNGSGAHSPPRFILSDTTLAGDRIRFGPATGDWPTVRSVGVWVSTETNNGAGVLGAYITLSAAQRFTLNEHYAFDITDESLYFTLPDRTDAGLGWHGNIEFFDDIMGLDNYTGSTAAYPRDTEDEGFVAHRDESVYCTMNIYSSNPLAQGGPIDSPLRTINQVGTVYPRTGYGSFYYSPGLHALVNYGQLRTSGGDAGTATHWLVARTTRSNQVTRANTLFLGQFSPGVALTQDQTMFFDRRAVRCPMTFGG